MKLVLLVGIIFYTAEARVHTQLEGEIVREWVDEYKFQDPSSHSYQSSTYYPKFSADTGLTCHKCAECHDALQFGLCIDGATASKCLCKWGWTVQLHKESLPQMKLVNGAETEYEQTAARHPATTLMIFGESLYLYVAVRHSLSWESIWTTTVAPVKVLFSVKARLDRLVAFFWKKS